MDLPEIKVWDEATGDWRSSGQYLVEVLPDDWGPAGDEDVVS